MEAPKKISRTDYDGLTQLAKETLGNLKSKTSAPLTVVKIMGVLLSPVSKVEL